VLESSEDVVKHDKLDSLGVVLLVDRFDVVANCSGNVLYLVRIVPDLVEQLQVHLRMGWLVHAIDEVRDRIALLVTKIYSSEAIDRHIGSRLVTVGNMHKGLHGGLGLVRPEPGLLAYPLRAFACDRPLS